jgi:hypothetical protein
MQNINELAFIIYLSNKIFYRVNTTLEYRFHISSFSPRKGSIRGGTKLNIYGEGFK